MSEELIHTSAPRGLKPGSSGFCTVAVDGGMSKNLMMVLERLSAYEFFFSLSDPQANLNPVNYSHALITGGSQTFSVLSRVAFSGADYSGRTNKIAHHFLLSNAERLNGGPAWMVAEMAEKELFAKEWQNEPQELASRHLDQFLPGVPGVPGPAENWERAAGDSGWAGALARAFRENRKVPAYVVYKPGMDILSLFEESLALLPPPERWQVCFSTYYTSLPPGVYYHWRAVLAGSAAAKEMSRFPNAVVVDLTGPVPQPEENEYTQAARDCTVLPAIGKPVPASLDGGLPASPEPEVRLRDEFAEQRAPATAALQTLQAPAQQHQPRMKRFTAVTAVMAAVIVLLLVMNIVALLMGISSQREIAQLKDDISAIRAEASARPSAAVVESPPADQDQPEKDIEEPATPANVDDTSAKPQPPQPAPEPKSTEPVKAPASAGPGTEPDTTVLGNPPDTGKDDTTVLGKTLGPIKVDLKQPDKPIGPPPPPPGPPVPCVLDGPPLPREQPGAEPVDQRTRADDLGVLSFEVGSANRLLDIPKELIEKGFRWRGEGNERSIKLIGASDWTLATCRLKEKGGKFLLVCVPDPRCAKEHGDWISSLRVEIGQAAGGGRATVDKIYRCSLGPLPREMRIRVGREKNGQAVKPQEPQLKYPWPGLLKLKGPKVQPAALAKGFRTRLDGTSIRLAFDVPETGDIVKVSAEYDDIVFVEKATEAVQRISEQDKAISDQERKLQPVRDEIASLDAKIQNEDARVKEHRANNRNEQADAAAAAKKWLEEERAKQQEILARNEAQFVDPLTKKRKGWEDQLESIRSNLAKMAAACTENAPLQIVDPWGAPVATVRVELCACEPSLMANK